MSTDPAWDNDAQVAALRAQVGAELLPIFTDDATLKRFLRARKGDVAKAATMLREHAQWRRETTPHWPDRALDLAEVEIPIKAHVAFIHGKDKEGRPLGFIRVKNHDGKIKRDILYKWVVACLDEIIARCERPSLGYISTFAFVIDAGDMAWANFDSDALKYILSVLGNHFPERLGQLMIINSGMLFRMVWKVVEPFLDARTSAKITFLGSDWRDVLRSKLEPDSIPNFLGILEEGQGYDYSPDHVPSRWHSVLESPLPTSASASPAVAATMAAGSGSGGSSSSSTLP